MSSESKDPKNSKNPMDNLPKGNIWTALIITLALFLLVYALIYFCWLRASFKVIKKGPGAYLPKPAEPAADDEEAMI